MTNLQEKTWAGQFGKDYTDRCTFSPEELDSLYKREYGISREEMNTRFLSGLGLRTREFWKLGAMLAIS